MPNKGDAGPSAQLFVGWVQVAVGVLSGVPVDLGRDGQEPDGDEDKGKAQEVRPGEAGAQPQHPQDGSHHGLRDGEKGGLHRADIRHAPEIEGGGQDGARQHHAAHGQPSLGGDGAKVQRPAADGQVRGDAARSRRPGRCSSGPAAALG